MVNNGRGTWVREGPTDGTTQGSPSLFSVRDEESEGIPVGGRGREREEDSRLSEEGSLPSSEAWGNVGVREPAVHSSPSSLGLYPLPTSVPEIREAKRGVSRWRTETDETRQEPGISSRDEPRRD